ncbi:putative methyltransferase-domain-containing protein [Cantharellus anzutake]|uniref:putative methyltransferase-domain-containing protein n=1 Tax=Cantharellus anzutake TaxID=1750568 RepID=UPI00190536C6|nr:putative methyltransferase-domain-containing protein [Cantharellus anzutake]KAF8332332.1 putative methyltransferase-domain-containing protein [Cantharellus anzutake]
MDFDEALGLDMMFPEPERPPSPEPTTERYTRSKANVNRARSDGVIAADVWESIDVRLVGSHPLWGDHLWNAAKVFANLLDADSKLLCEGKNVLELGAGGALPGMVAALSGARRVVITDYPDHDLIDNINYNVEKNVPLGIRSRVHVQGFKWGARSEGLLDALKTSGETETPRFDLILMSDLIFNHSQHDALLRTCEETLAPDSGRSFRTEDTSLVSTPVVLVFYTHHRPHLAHRDLNFFEKAKNRGWKCEEIFTVKMPVMFPEDSGDVEIRSTVHGWRVYR